MTSYTRCKRGFHLYDETKHDNCPYCPKSGIESEIPPTRPAPSSSQGSPLPTQPYNHQSSAGHTRGVWQLQHEGEAPITIEPVVGWVVCVRGVNIGRDYRLRAGRNSLGRESSMDVCISGDDKISRENHAHIAYDPENRTFYLQHGEGRNLTYVNNKPALTLVQLEAGDRIKCGGTELIFVPLCDKRFNWDDLESD